MKRSIWCTYPLVCITILNSKKCMVFLEGNLWIYPGTFKNPIADPCNEEYSRNSWSTDHGCCTVEENLHIYNVWRVLAEVSSGCAGKFPTFSETVTLNCRMCQKMKWIKLITFLYFKGKSKRRNAHQRSTRNKCYRQKKDLRLHSWICEEYDW